MFNVPVHKISPQNAKNPQISTIEGTCTCHAEQWPSKTTTLFCSFICRYLSQLEKNMCLVLCNSLTVNWSASLSTDIPQVCYKILGLLMPVASSSRSPRSACNAAFAAMIWQVLETPPTVPKLIIYLITASRHALNGKKKEIRASDTMRMDKKISGDGEKFPRNTKMFLGLT
jgi:hypothetical protein